MAETKNKLKENSLLKLLLYRSIPAKEEAWLAGYEASKNSYELTDNPYRKSDDEYTLWEHGWWDFFENNEEIFNLLTDKD